MSSHIPVELLSSYLDSELSEAEASAVERHVRQCATCRDDLQGLRWVVTGLRGLERAAVPSVLAQDVERRVALERRPRGLIERLEAQLERRSKIDPGLVLGFALVLALAVIFYLFADAVERRRQGEVPIVVPGASSAAADRSNEVTEVAGRVFRRRDDWWTEDGATVPTRVLGAHDPAALELRLAHPWLEELLVASRGVVLLEGGESIAIEPPSPD